MSSTRGISIIAVLVASFGVFAHADETTRAFEGEFKIADVPRFDDLPTRFYLRPEFQIPEPKKLLQKDFVDLFVRVVDGDYDEEISVQAARSLQRVAREKLADPEMFSDALRTRLQKSTSRNVRRSCAMALAEVGDQNDADLLAELCLPGDEVLCAAIEPTLAKWKSEALLDSWQQRIQTPKKYSQTLLQLACRGVAELNATQTVSDLQKLAASDSTRFSTRRVASEALGRVAPDSAFKLASELSKSGISDRILAILLLNSATSDDALGLAEHLCDDKEDAVAAVAWNTLVRLKPERLLSRLNTGKTHRDPNVRSAVVRTAGLLPTEERCDLLSEILSDIHIGVRNEARRTLQTLAENNAKLHSQICANAGAVIENSQSTWQQLEQSLLLLGHLRHDAHQRACVPLLTHDRGEVLVTAAWLLHLMPQDSLGEAAASVAAAHWAEMKKDSQNYPRFHALDEQLAFLLHVAAYTDRTELKSLCAEQFSKQSLLHPDGRAIAMWTLGELSKGSKDDALVGQFAERVFDDSEIFPEYDTVRCGSALAIGLVGGKTAIPELRRAHTAYGVGGIIGNCVSSALRTLGEDAPQPPELEQVYIQDWPLHPTTKNRGNSESPAADANAASAAKETE